MLRGKRKQPSGVPQGRAEVLLKKLLFLPPHTPTHMVKEDEWDGLNRARYVHMSASPFPHPNGYSETKTYLSCPDFLQQISPTHQMDKHR